MSLYTEMLEAGLVIGNHYSDLYVKDNAESRAIYAKYKGTIAGPDSFVSNTGEGRCLDFPFAFEPYWEARGMGVAGKVANEICAAVGA